MAYADSVGPAYLIHAIFKDIAAWDNHSRMSTPHPIRFIAPHTCFVFTEFPVDDFLQLAIFNHLCRYIEPPGISPRAIENGIIHHVNINIFTVPTGLPKRPLHWQAAFLLPIQRRQATASLKRSPFSHKITPFHRFHSYPAAEDSPMPPFIIANDLSKNHDRKRPASSQDCGPDFLPLGRPGRAPLRAAPTPLGSRVRFRLAGRCWRRDDYHYARTFGVFAGLPA